MPAWSTPPAAQASSRRSRRRTMTMWSRGQPAPRVSSTKVISATHQALEGAAVAQCLSWTPSGPPGPPFRRTSFRLLQGNNSVTGHTHVIHQSEGGEQGDALMPMLHAPGQHGALPLPSRFSASPRKPLCSPGCLARCVIARWRGSHLQTTSIGSACPHTSPLGKNPSVESKRTCATRLPRDARNCGTR